jgi:flagellar basal-body rod protein FlgB
MQDLAVFSVAQARSRWLAARASAIANNIAHADSPGYKARDVAPFEQALKSAAATVTRTQAGHMSISDSSETQFELVHRAVGTTKHSGNGVSLEAEMASLGDARSQQSAVTGVIAAFNRMLLSSVKG